MWTSVASNPHSDMFISFLFFPYSFLKKEKSISLKSVLCFPDLLCNFPSVLKANIFKYKVSQVNYFVLYQQTKWLWPSALSTQVEEDTVEIQHDGDPTAFHSVCVRARVQRRS